MNLKNIRLFYNSQSRLSKEKLSPTLHNSTIKELTNNNSTVYKSHNAADNNFLVMFESDIKKHWGI